MKKDNIVKQKSFLFAIRIVKVCRFIQTELKDFVLSKQLLRSGTSVGAMVRESEHSESKADFIHKLSIAQKEANETLYWLELLRESEMLENKYFESIYPEAQEIIKLITAIIKTTKTNLKLTINHL